MTLKTCLSFLNEKQLVGEESYSSPTSISHTSCEVILGLWHTILPGFGQVTPHLFRASLPEVTSVVSKEMGTSGRLAQARCNSCWEIPGSLPWEERKHKETASLNRLSGWDKICTCAPEQPLTERLSYPASFLNSKENYAIFLCALNTVTAYPKDLFPVW